MVNYWRPDDRTFGQADLAKCQSWIATRTDWGVAEGDGVRVHHVSEDHLIVHDDSGRLIPEKTPALYLEPGGEFFRPIQLHEWTLAGWSCMGGVPSLYIAVPKADAEALLRFWGYLPDIEPSGTPKRRRGPKAVADVHAEAEEYAVHAYVDRGLKQHAIAAEVREEFGIDVDQSWVSRAIAKYYPDPEQRRRIRATNRKRPFFYIDTRKLGMGGRGAPGHVIRKPIGEPGDDDG
jgi:hypothetical protein